MKYVVELYKDNKWQANAMFIDFDDAMEYGGGHLYGTKVQIRNIQTQEIVIEMEDY